MKQQRLHTWVPVFQRWGYDANVGSNDRVSGRPDLEDWGDRLLGTCNALN